MRIRTIRWAAGAALLGFAAASPVGASDGGGGGDPVIIDSRRAPLAFTVSRRYLQLMTQAVFAVQLSALHPMVFYAAATQPQARAWREYLTVAFIGTLVYGPETMALIHARAEQATAWTARAQSTASAAPSSLDPQPAGTTVWHGVKGDLQIERERTERIVRNAERARTDAGFRRELERLAGRGNVEAQETLRQKDTLDVIHATPLEIEPGVRIRREAAAKAAPNLAEPPRRIETPPDYRVRTTIQF